MKTRQPKARNDFSPQRASRIAARPGAVGVLLRVSCARVARCLITVLGLALVAGCGGQGGDRADIHAPGEPLRFGPFSEPTPWAFRPAPANTPPQVQRYALPNVVNARGRVTYAGSCNTPGDWAFYDEVAHAIAGAPAGPRTGADGAVEDAGHVGEIGRCEVTARDASGGTGTLRVRIVAASPPPPPRTSDPRFAAGEYQVAFTQHAYAEHDLPAVTGGVPPYTFTLDGCPDWMRLEGSLLVGFPGTDDVGLSNCTLIAEDAGIPAESARKLVLVRVRAGDGLRFAAGEYQVAFTQHVYAEHDLPSVTGGVEPYTFTLEGCPDWVRLEGQHLIGFPGEADVGLSNCTLRVEDVGTPTASAEKLIRILLRAGEELQFAPFSHKTPLPFQPAPKNTPPQVQVYELPKVVNADGRVTYAGSCETPGGWAFFDKIAHAIAGAPAGPRTTTTKMDSEETETVEDPGHAGEVGSCEVTARDASGATGSLRIRIVAATPPPPPPRTSDPQFASGEFEVVFTQNAYGQFALPRVTGGIQPYRYSLLTETPDSCPGWVRLEGGVRLIGFPGDGDALRLWNCFLRVTDKGGTGKSDEKLLRIRLRAPVRSGFRLSSTAVPSQLFPLRVRVESARSPAACPRATRGVSAMSLARRFLMGCASRRNRVTLRLRARATSTIRRTLALRAFSSKLTTSQLIASTSPGSRR